MILLSIVAKTYAWALWPDNRWAALICWCASVVLDVAHFRRQHAGPQSSGWQLVREVGLMNLAMLLVGYAVQSGLAYAAMRWKSGLSMVAFIPAMVLRSLGLSLGVFAGDLVMTTMAGPLTFAVSLDHLGPTIPVGIAASCAVYLLLTASNLRQVMRSLAVISVILAGVCIVRFVLATGLFLALCDLVSYETEELPWGPFVRPATMAATYLPFLLVSLPLLARWLATPAPATPLAPQTALLRPWILTAGLTCLLLIALWEPEGSLKTGKVLINTYHTQWSRTDRPYDREWYGADSGYNYACLKRWFEVFYDVRELKTRLQAKDLEGVSVLFIYLPDRAFTEEERRLIQEFVRNGGGVFLIGDHTNVFGSTTHLNEICQVFGFEFRDDVLFDLDDDFFQLLDVPRTSPALLRNFSFFKFRGPTSIQPTTLATRPIMLLDHAKSLRAIYSVNNFYPPPHDHPSMQSGRFCVSATARYGQGRVVAFADSTVFSNFEIFYPGKYEYLLNVVHWLNHEDGLLDAFIRRGSLIAAVLLCAWFLFRFAHPQSWLQGILGTLAAYYVAGMLSLAWERLRWDLPAPIHPAQALFFVAEPKDPVYGLREFSSQVPYDQRYEVLTQWVLRTKAFSGFYLTGSDQRNELFEHMQASATTKTAMAIIVNDTNAIERLKTVARGPGAKTKRWCLLFSRKLDWDAIAAALRSSGLLSQTNLLDRIKLNWPNGEVALEDGPRRLVLVFSAERFSDQSMGFSEKVVPNEAQHQVFNQAFELVDRVFAETAQQSGTKP
jgi:hypothetical protein